MPSSILVCCPSCHKMNRFPAEKLHDNPHCGVCKDYLFQKRVIDLTVETFDQHVLQSEIPTLVDFMGFKCNPCKVMKPVFQQIADRLEPELYVARVNTDEMPALSTRFKLCHIPTIMLFTKGKEVNRLEGTLPFPGLLQWIEDHLK